MDPFHCGLHFQWSVPRGPVYDLATLSVVNKTRNGQLGLFRSFSWAFKIVSRKEIQISFETRTVTLNVGESATISCLWCGPEKKRRPVYTEREEESRYMGAGGSKESLQLSRPWFNYLFKTLEHSYPWMRIAMRQFFLLYGFNWLHLDWFLTLVTNSFLMNKIERMILQ